MDLQFDSGFAPEDAQETFESMLSESHRELEARMVEAGLTVEKGASQRSPVQTGNLRASWESETNSSGDTIVTEVGSNVHYAPHVEYGTVHMNSQPMLRPSLDEESRDLIRDIEQLVYRVAESEGNV